MSRRDRGESLVPHSLPAGEAKLSGGLTDGTVWKRHQGKEDAGRGV